MIHNKIIAGFIFDIFLGAFALCFPLGVNAFSYYVDATGGSDSSDGKSSGAAWQTVSKVNGSTFSPGDYIYFKYGETWNESLLFPSSGNSSSNITIDAYGDSNLSKPKFEGLDTITGWSLSSGSIYSASVTYNGSNTFQAFEDGARLIKKTSTGAMTAGSFYYDNVGHVLYVWASDSANLSTHTIKFSMRAWGFQATGQQYLVVNNLWFDGFAMSGVNLRDPAGRITVNHSISSWNSMRGFDLGTDVAKDDVVVKTSVTYDNIGEGFWAGNGNRLGFDGNTAYNNAKDNITAGYNAPIAGSNFTIGIDCVDCFMRNNTSYNGYKGTDTFDVEWEASGARPLRTIVENNIIQKSLAINTDNARDAGTDTVWRNNVFYSNASMPLLRVWNGASGTHIYFNTFHPSNASSETPCIYVLDSTNVISKNNIFYGTNQGYVYNIEDTGSTGFVSNYNRWVSGRPYGGYWIGSAYSLAAWQVATGLDLNSTSGDPLFVNALTDDYHLQATSDVIDQGTDVGVTTDIEGNSRPQALGFDLGAYEYTIPTPTPSPTPIPTTVPSISSLSVNTGGISAASCTNTYPGEGKTPFLYGAIAQDTSSVLLYFAPGSEPFDHYALEFGNIPGLYPFAAENIAAKGTYTYLVKGLKQGVTYYFRVREGNGCAAGKWSNVLKATTLSNLNVVSNTLMSPSPTPMPTAASLVETTKPDILNISSPMPNQATTNKFEIRTRFSNLLVYMPIVLIGIGGLAVLIIGIRL